MIVPSWAPESSSGSSEAGSSSCPPEIGRERHAPREARADSPRRLPDPAAGGEGREGMQTAALASELDGNGLGGGEKIAHMEHARLRPTLASLSLAPEPRQPIPSQPITSEELERERVAKQEEAKPLYLSHLGSPRERVRHIMLACSVCERHLTACAFAAIAALDDVLSAARQQVPRHAAVGSPAVRRAGGDQGCGPGRVVPLWLPPDTG